jgi:tetratricopeptide (TPR) repeat protein
MSRSTRTLVALTLLVALSASTALWAQAFGRVVIRVKDAEGNPIPGAKITITNEELPNFLIEAETKKKGQATVAFADATKFYQLTVEKEGYETENAILKAELRTTTEEEIVLRERGEEVTLPSGEVQTRRFSPSEKLYNEGVQSLKAGDLQTAAAKFLEALAENPDLGPAHSALAAVYLEEKKYEEAVASANRFLELSPNQPSAYRVLYEAYRNLGREAEAEEALAQVTSLGDSADSAILLYNEGVEALRMDQNDVARERFEAALAANPQLAAAMVALAKLDIDAGDSESAAARTEQALAIEPDNYTALLIQYQAYSDLAETEKADAAFQQLATVAPDRVGRLFYDKGIELFNAGDSQAAADSFERALAADPTLVKGHYHLGLAYVNAGATAQAKEHLQKFLELAPDDPDAGTATEMLQYLGN